MLQIYKQTIVLYLLTTISIFIIRTETKKSMKLIVEHRQLLDIPSASGIVQSDDDLYVIGDDSAWLYQLNEHYGVCHRELLLKNV